MKILTLTIKKKWYDMILSGEKKEEYREIKPFYKARFGRYFWMNSVTPKAVRFRNGYRKDSPALLAKCILRTGTGRTEWGAEEGKTYYVLQILEAKEE